MQEIKLSNGEIVKMHDVVKRKTQTEWNKIMFAETETNSEGKIKMNLGKLDEANNKLVQLMTVEKKGLEWINNLDNTDFEKLLEACHKNKIPEKDKKK